MIPKKLYETLPYLYMAIGVLVLFVLGNYFALFSGLMFFMAGSLIWILRSDHRRASRKHHGPLPHWLYELLPFIYAAVGLVLYNYAHTIYLYPSAVLLLVAGLQIWYLRGAQRRHQQPTGNRLMI